MRRLSVLRFFGGVSLVLMMVGLRGGAPAALTTQPMLVADINLTALVASPAEFEVVGTTLFFTANDPSLGIELWKTDGTAAGTVLVKDINPGSNSSAILNLTNVNGTLFFAANDGVNGVELWKSDGTAAGTVMVADISAGNSSSPIQLTNVNGTLFFLATDIATGYELWKSNGTSATTVLVKDIWPGTTSSVNSNANLTEVNGTLYFVAIDNLNASTRLFKSDGTAAGTVVVSTNVNTPANLTAVGTTLFFRGTGGLGVELWKSNGTSATTVFVKDINPGSTNSTPQSLTNMGGTLFFIANDGTNGFEFWKSDGTSVGTVMVKDINPGTGNGVSSSLVNANGTLFFVGCDPATGCDLWKSNGTTATTVLVKDIAAPSSPTTLTAVGNKVFYQFMDSSANGFELWTSDGTAAGTVLVEDITPGTGSTTFSQLTDFNGVLAFSANASLWRSDGTAAGTSAIYSVPGTANSSPSSFASLGSTLYFQANDGVKGAELWKTDGTPAGTSLLKDILLGSNGSLPQAAIAVNGTLYFNAANSQGSEPWKSDGTAAGTSMIADVALGNASSAPHTFIPLNGAVYFLAQTTATGGELYKTDGTAAGTAMVKDVFPGTGNTGVTSLFAGNGYLIFPGQDAANNQEPWVSDGTAPGTVKLKEINPTGHSFPTTFALVGNTVFFLATDGVIGRELWKTDGTTAGTVLVKDINPAGDSLAVGVGLGNTYIFTAENGTLGRELWRSDGTAAGTVLVKDIYPGATGSESNITASVVVDGWVYFVANDGVHGRELWRTDGTAANTTMVKDIRPGAEHSTPEQLLDYNGTLVFRANDGVNGVELWQSDGTAAGTMLVADINPGTGHSNPTFLKVVDGQLFFAAFDGLTGVELYVVPKPKADQTITVDTPAPASSAYGSTFAVAASVNSGLDVTITVDPAPVCHIVSGGTGTASIQMDTGSGTCVVHYNQAGDSSHNPAPEVTSDTAASKLVPTVSFADAPATAGYLAGFTVSSATNATSVPLYTSSGACTNTGTAYSMTSGSGTCTSTVTWATDANYQAASLSQITNAARLDPAVTFTGAPVSRTYLDTFTVASTTQSSAAPLYSASGACSNAGDFFTMTSGTGTCTSTVTWAADDNYNGATRSQATAASKATPVVTFTGAPASLPYLGSFTVSSTTTGLTPAVYSASGVCTNAGAVFTMSSGTGVCASTATWVADDNYTSASLVQTTTAQKIAATVVVSGFSGSYDGGPHGASGTATGANGANLTPSLDLGASFTDVPGGTAHWIFSGGSNYLDQAGDAAIAVTPAASTVVVSCPASVPYTGAAHTACTAEVTGAGGFSEALVVSYSDNLNAGLATATASYAGNGNRAPGSDSATFTIAKADATVVVNGYTGVYDGNPHGASGAATGVGGVNLSAALSLGASFTAVPGGTAQWTFNGAPNYNDQTGSAAISLTAAPSSVVVTCPVSVPYTGAAQTPCSAQVTGAGLSQALAVSYSDNTNAGTATASASYAGDGDRAPANASTTFAIAKADALVSVAGFSGPYDGAAHHATGTATGVGGVDLSAALSLGASFTDAPGGTGHWTFDGGTNYNDRSGDALIAITVAASTVTVTCPAGVTYTGAPQTPCTASASGAGLSQALSVGYTDNLDAGTSTATASYAGDGNHAPGSGTATFSIGKAVAQVLVLGFAGPYDGSAHGATGTATGVGGVNLIALLQLGGTFTEAPGGTAHWTFSGGTNYHDQAGDAAVSITAAPSAISVVCAPGVPYTGAPQTPCSATVTGAGDLSQSVLVSYQDNINAGTATATASFVATANNAAATGSATFTIPRADAAIVVNGYSGLYDGTAHGATGTATGAGDADLSGSLLLGASFTSAPGGTAHWTFSGGTNYNDAAGDAPIVITAASSTVTVTCPAGVSYTGAAHTPCSATVTGAGLNQPLAVGYADNVNAGTATASAAYAGDVNRAPASGSATFAIAKATQGIVFAPLPNRTLGEAPFTVAASGNLSGNPILFATTTPAVCASSGANGSTITMTAAGTCSVRASLAGNGNYEAAADVTQSFQVVGSAVSFAGLFSPWAPPGPGTYNGQSFAAGTVFKTNSTLPVKWGYAVGGVLVDSARANSAQFPVLSVFGPLAQCGALDGSGSDAVVAYSGPGNTTVTYDAATKTWQRNLKLDGSFQADKCYLLQVFDPVDGTTSPSFPIKTKK